MICLNCHSDSAMLMGDTRVTNGMIITEDVCLSCCLCFKEFVRPHPNSSTKAERMRATFTNHGKLTKSKLAELKAHDQVMYHQWLRMVRHLESTIAQQKESNYSEHATHFLHLMQILLHFLESQLEHRINVIEMFLKGVNES